MNQSRLWIAAAIIAVGIIIIFAFSAPRAQAPKPEAETATKTETAVPSVAIRDHYRKGTHTITGSLQAPNPCTSATAEATTTGSASTTQRILVSILMPEDTGICLEEPATLSFSTTIDAPSDVPITVTVNGVTATTTAL